MGIADPRRNAELAVIHLAAKELGLDDTTYRMLLRRVSFAVSREAKGSTALFTGRERGALIEELHRLGFRRPKEPRPARPPGAAQEGKILELWRMLDQAGALRDSSEAALRAFIKRQTGGAGVARWLTAAQANLVIEGLKAWLKRSDGSATGKREPEPRRDNGAPHDTCQ